MVFGQKWLYLDKSSCIRAKVVVFGQKWFFHSGKSGCNRAKLLYLAKLVVFGQNGCIPEKVVVFGQSGCIRSKLFLFEQICCIAEGGF